MVPAREQNDDDPETLWRRGGALWIAGLLTPLARATARDSNTRGGAEAEPTAENGPPECRSSEAVVNNPFFLGTNYPQTLKPTWRLLTYPFKLFLWTTVLTPSTRRPEPRYPGREGTMSGWSNTLAAFWRNPFQLNASATIM
jgi:hypothetical protein